MTAVGPDSAEQARLSRVLNRSRVIQAERRRRRRRLATLAVAVMVTGSGALAGTTLLRPSVVTPQPTADIGPTTPPASPGPGGTTAGALWESGVVGANSSGPAYGLGRVFVMAGDRSVIALDASSGAVLWSHTVVVPSPDVLPRSTATVDFAQGLVIAAGPDVPLQALDARTGALRWTTAGTSPTEAQRGVAVLDDTVVVANGAGAAAFDLLTGRPRWSTALGPAHGAAGRGNVVVVSVDSGPTGAVVALDARDGSTLWRRALDATVTARPAFASDGVAVVVDDHGVLYRLDTEDGHELGRVEVARCRPCTATNQPSASQPTVVGGRIIVGTADGLVAVDEASGAVAWRHPTASPVTSSPIPFGRRAVVVTTVDPPSLIEVDAASGRLTATVPLAATASERAVALSSAVVVTTADGRVTALRHRSGP